MNELEIGQRIPIYACVANDFNLPVIVGNTYLGYRVYGSGIFKDYVLLFDGNTKWVMLPEEVKKIGMLVVTGVVTNSDPCTII